MSQPTETMTEQALKDFRAAGVVEKSPRLFHSKKMTGFNAEVYACWIERWANNAAANYPVVRRADGVAFLRKAAKDVPAVVVGIGPSLDDSIADLKRAPRHAIVIATDAALRPLARHGIHPDLVINFDARDEQRTMWTSVDTSPYVLLANSATSPLTIDAWRGSLMFFNMLQHDDEFCTNILPALYPHIGQLPNMGTVGNGAVFLAWQMGCKPILGVGMDLCYQLTPESPASAILPPKDSILGAAWKYRCKDWTFIPPTAEIPNGDWQESENKVLYDNSERMKGTIDEVIKGKTYKTDECLKFYRNSLVSNVGQFDIPLINCSGGVLSDLLPTMSLRQALETKCYDALEPGRSTVKFLRTLLPDAKRGDLLDPTERIFVPNPNADIAPPTHKR